LGTKIPFFDLAFLFLLIIPVEVLKKSVTEEPGIVKSEID
jgi:hypothetical protein